MTKALEQTTLATEEHSCTSSDESVSFQNSSPLPQLLSEVAQLLPDDGKKLTLIQLAILVF